MTAVLLVAPPFTDPSQPGAAIPSLAAALDGASCEVHAWDLNLDAWEYLLDPARQRRWLARVARRLGALERRASLTSAERLEYAALADGWLRGSAALDELAGAPDVLRSQAFYDVRAYRRAVHAIDGALAVLSAAYHPARFEWGRFWPAASVAASREVLRAAGSPRASPFVAYARERVLPRLLSARPSILGLSITYLDQIVPALAIAAACRRALPGVRIVVGGQIPSLWGDAVDDRTALWRVVDAMVCGDGEEPLRAIVAAVADGRPLGGIPGVRVRAGRYRPAFPQPASQLPCPDYRVLPLHRYLAPEPVLTVAASRGCYWGRCAFCAVSPAFRDGFRLRPPPLVRSDLEALSALHGARHFFFADDALPRPMVDSLVAEPWRASPIRWQAELRWDALDEADVEALARAGARNLVFGLESGSPRVLRRMRKGADLRRAERLVRRCSDARVGVNLQCFLGFPGETRSDAAATVEFIRRVRGPRVTVSCGLFELQKGSGVWKEPQAYGVAIRPPARGRDLVTRYDHAPVANRAFRDALLHRIRRRFATAVPQMRCGIHAHALLWLAADRATPVRERARKLTGTASLRPSPGTAHRVFAWNPAAPGRRAPTALAYALDAPSCTEIGQVGVAVLGAFRAGASLSTTLAPLTSGERRRVRRVVAAMVGRGLLSARPAPSRRRG